MLKYLIVPIVSLIGFGPVWEGRQYPNMCLSGDVFAFCKC